MIKIILADYDSSLREGLKSLFQKQFDFELIGVGKDGYEAIKLVETTQPDVVLLDLDLPLFSGMRVCSSIKMRSLKTSIILLANYLNTETIIEALNCNVSGFVIKATMRDEICDAIRSVFSGTPYMSHETGVSFYNILSDVIKRKAAALQPHLLYNKNYCKHPFLISRIEFQVTSLIGGGFSNNEIADFLELRESTIRNYVSLILQKTGLEHRSQIAIYALNNGFASHQDLMRRYGPKIRRNMQLSVKTGIRPRRKSPSELYLPFSD